MKKILLVFSTLLLLSGCSILQDENDVIDVVDLVAEYEDLDAANLKYAGTELSVTGVVISNLGSLTNDGGYLSLVGRIICHYSNEDEEAIHLDKNLRVVVKGIVQFRTEDSNNIELNECELVEVTTTPYVVTTAEDFTELDFEDLYFQVVEISGIVQFIEPSNLVESKSIFLENSDYSTGIEIQFNFLNETVNQQLSGIEASDNVVILCVIMPASSHDFGIVIFGFDVKVVE